MNANVEMIPAMIMEDVHVAAGTHPKRSDRERNNFPRAPAGS
jgi:hypothetical protein